MKARTSFIMKITDTISSEDEKQICAVISDAASDVKDINISDNEIRASLKTPVQTGKSMV